MAATTIHAAAGRRAALALQIRLLWFSRRPISLLALMLTFVTGAVVVSGYIGGATVLFDFAPGVLLVAGVWGVLIWRDEGPAKRSYHVSLPVDIPTHLIMRVAAGAVWLLLGVGVFLGAGLLAAALNGDGPAAVRALPLLLPHYALSPLLVYLLAATVSTISNRPAEWLVLAYVMLVLLTLLAQLPALKPIATMLDVVLTGAWGIGTAVTAGVKGAEAVAASRVAPGTAYAEWVPVAALWLAITTTAVMLGARSRRARP